MRAKSKRTQVAPIARPKRLGAKPGTLAGSELAEGNSRFDLARVHHGCIHGEPTLPHTLYGRTTPEPPSILFVLKLNRNYNKETHLVDSDPALPHPPHPPRHPGSLGSHGPRVTVHPLPGPDLGTALPGSVAIVIDLLRASTTIVHALAAGAPFVRPVVTVEEARALVTGGEGASGPLLAGEREGLAPPGFDFGNSPRDLTGESVGSRPIVFTTTNGTRAIHSAAGAECVLIGALVNLTATAEFAARLDRPVRIVCAGTGGRTTEEDVLCAGAYVEALATLGIGHEGAEAMEALRAWEAATDLPDSVLQAMRASRGGRNLIGIRLDRDIADAARVDLFALVARFDQASGTIVHTASM